MPRVLLSHLARWVNTSTVMLSCLPRRGFFQRKPNKSCLCIEKSPKSSWCLYKSRSYRDSGVHHPEVGFAPGMDALTQLPSLLGILQQDTERRPLWHGDVELDKSLLVLWQLSIGCRWEKQRGRGTEGKVRAFKELQNFRGDACPIPWTHHYLLPLLSPSPGCPTLSHLSHSSSSRSALLLQRTSLSGFEPCTPSQRGREPKKMNLP